MQHNARGAVQQCLFINSLKEFTISLPSLDIQKKIAEVLGTLDDKIELNNKVNNNLEPANDNAASLKRRWHDEMAIKRFSRI